jgi:chemotaxis protein MotB
MLMGSLRGRLLIVGMALIASGCAVKFSKRSPWDIQQLATLSDQLEQFRALAQLKAEEAERLREAKALLEKRLSSEIAAQDISVGFDERGLVVRMLDRILFNSGKADLRQDAYPVLDKVARVLNRELTDQPVRIEGHTDNEPIKQSGWKDNWELSLARARAVLSYLVQERDVDPARVSGSGYGEYHPIASNETAEGRRMNRRVEIVVSPREAVASQSGLRESSVSSGATSAK